MNSVPIMFGFEPEGVAVERERPVEVCHGYGDDVDSASVSVYVSGLGRGHDRQGVCSSGHTSTTA